MGRITAYEPFPDDPGRNARQERMEVPVMVRCLALPRGVRMLEVGCGRGVALSGLARLCEPSSLVGLDFDAALVAEARRRLEETRTRCELVVGDVRTALQRGRWAGLWATWMRGDASSGPAGCRRRR
jgi:protein-L-isoaspartate O-methyltransferase